jgi:truncated hemoglobin YjbI
MVVQDFYEDLLQDPALGHFFERVSIVDLAEHQTIFLTMVMGGPMGYTAGDIARGHSGMHVGHVSKATDSNRTTSTRSSPHTAGTNPPLSALPEGDGLGQ